MIRALSRGARLAAWLAAAAGADQLEYTTYYFKDNAENKVATSSFSLAKTLWRKTVLLLDIELDQLTVPPLDGVSGASRPARRPTDPFTKNRGQVIAGVEQGLGPDTRLAATYYNSQEVDYRSQSAIGSLTQELFQKNTTLTLRGQYTYDLVGEITADGSVADQVKETRQGAFILSQLLSPTTVFRTGLDAVWNQGYLSDPYRLVPVEPLAPEGDPAAPPPLVKERHPDSRKRGAAWLELSQFLTPLDGSALVNYRFYRDDWKVQSHTFQVKLNKYIGPDWILSPEYRFYTQTAAYFARDAYTAADAYWTGDYKLKAFDSHTAGLGLSYFLRGLAHGHPDLDFLANSSVAVTYFRYFNTQDFSANVVEGRVKFAF